MKFFYLIIILLSLISITSCEEDGFKESEVKPVNIATKKDGIDLKSLRYTYNDVKMACEEGCLYDYQLYTIANSLQKKAVSLNTVQLKSIKSACNYFCSKKVFNAIKKDRKSEELLNKKLKEVEDIKDFTEESDSELDEELIPFEEL
jgi:hypothetical protein